MALAPLNTPGDAGATTRKPLGNLAAAQHKKHLRSAKTAIMAVAILTMLANGFVYYLVTQNEEKLDAQITALHNNVEMQVDEAQVEKARSEISSAKIQTGLFFLIGFVYFGLFFYVNSNPVVATTTALILYIVSFIAGVAMYPQGAAQGIIIKIIIVAALYKGMQSGQAIKKLEEAEAAKAEVA